GKYNQIHIFGLVTHLERRLLIELGQFRPHTGHRVTLILPSSEAISCFSVERRCKRSRSDWIMPTSNGMPMTPRTTATSPKSSPAVAIPFPRSAPQDLRIF